ncbi:MAG: aminotransferase class I/II-fold pyridoxal phosphate-dependent enzyme [Acidimicrobiia bacterium]|jgi:L-glutamine---4-(methylsulfanyl)-2-oxobutanoate aminotransferase
MVASRLAPFGSTVFTEISAAAAAHGAVDLGQGYPSWEGPGFVKEAAIAAIRERSNQYPPSNGVPELRRAIAERWFADTGMAIDPEAEVTVTSGCTEALAATFLGLFEPGDEVVLFEPAYDAYPVGCALSGAVPRYVTLRAPDFRFSVAELVAAVGPRTRAILVNTPHNPTGRVLDAAEMEAIAALARAHDLVVITDEVYERIVYEGTHLRMATLPGMWERTLTLSSIGKSFSLTGWKTGWAIGPKPLTAAVRAAHQFLTFTTPNPMQHGAAAALGAPQTYYEDLVDSYRGRRDLLVSGLAELGFELRPPEGSYYVLADHTRFGFEDDGSFVRHLITEIGVAAIPPSSFYHGSDEGFRLVRFAFCKDERVLTQALERLQVLG